MSVCNFSGYDAAVYSAAASYYHQQQSAKSVGTWSAKKAGTQQFKVKLKGPSKAPQLHYCDVCKISCAGPQVNGSVFRSLLLGGCFCKQCNNLESALEFCCLGACLDSVISIFSPAIVFSLLHGILSISRSVMN